MRIYTEGLARELLVLQPEISVHCLMPSVVNTKLLENSKKSSDEISHVKLNSKSMKQGLTPESVAQALLAGVHAKDFYIVVCAPQFPRSAIAETIRIFADDVEHGAQYPVEYLSAIGKEKAKEFGKRIQQAAKKHAKL